MDLCSLHHYQWRFIFNNSEIECSGLDKSEYIFRGKYKLVKSRSLSSGFQTPQVRIPRMRLTYYAGHPSLTPSLSPSLHALSVKHLFPSLNVYHLFYHFFLISDYFNFSFRLIFLRLHLLSSNSSSFLTPLPLKFKYNFASQIRSSRIKTYHNEFHF